MITDGQVEAAARALTLYDYPDGNIDKIWPRYAKQMRAALEAAAQAAPAVDLRAALELAWSHCDPFQVPDADIEIIEAALKEKP